MKVKDLIKRLQIYNQEFDIEIESECNKDEDVFSTIEINDVGVFNGSKSIIFISPKYK
jgi:hypothetical protein